MADAPVRSVLYDIQERQGGTFDDFGGWMWTLDFGDIAGEYEALRSGAGMWDVYALNKWLVTGPDAVSALQRGFTNNLATQQVGQVRYGAFVDADGILHDEGTIYRRADGSYFAFTNTDTFDAYVRGHSPDADVTLSNLLHEMPLVSVQGPTSRQILQSLSDFDFTTLPYFRFAEPVTVAGINVFISRTGFSGELGYELIPARQDAERLWLALADAGVRPVGFNAIDIARIEAGLIVFEYEYEPGNMTTPFDLGMDRMVSFSPDLDYLGRDALQRVAEAPPHRLKTLRLEAGELPEAGSSVTKDGAVVGTLTSPTNSPRFGPIALAIMKSAAADNDTVVQVAGSTATVAELAIFDPAKAKPRA